MHISSKVMKCKLRETPQIFSKQRHADCRTGELTLERGRHWLT